MRRHHFHVEGIRFDGAKSARVTIEGDGGEHAFVIRVRALRRPREAVMLLSDVAQITLERDAKQLAAEAPHARRRR